MHAIQQYSRLSVFCEIKPAGEMWPSTDINITGLFLGVISLLLCCCSVTVVGTECFSSGSSVSASECTDYSGLPQGVSHQGLLYLP